MSCLHGPWFHEGGWSVGAVYAPLCVACCHPAGCQPGYRAASCAWGGEKAGCLIFFQTGFSVHNGHMRAEKSSAQKHHLEIWLQRCGCLAFMEEISGVHYVPLHLPLAKSAGFFVRCPPPVCISILWQAAVIRAAELKRLFQKPHVRTHARICIRAAK